MNFFLTYSQTEFISLYEVVCYYFFLININTEYIVTNFPEC